MTNASRQRILLLFKENERIIKEMPSLEPSPKARLCSESAHFMLGHLTSAQAAWLPLMRAIRNGKTKGSVPINPNPLFTKLGLQTMPWEELAARFDSDRTEWRQMLEQVDLNHEILISKRIWTAQTLTQRMVLHERNHLTVHLETTPSIETIAQNGEKKF